MKDYKKQLGDVIRIYREKKEISQEVLGDNIGVTQQQINAYEQGNSAIYLDKAMQIADILDIPMSKFFEDTETRDLLKEFKKSFLKYHKTIEAIETNQNLEDTIDFYIKNKKELKEVNLLKILTRYLNVNDDEKPYAVKAIYNILRNG
jgi:transcriptional regulator with XRE-family HTH domain